MIYIAPLSELAPVGGFFTYGEFYSFDIDIGRGNQLLNQTMTVLALSENKELSKTNIKMELKLLTKDTKTIEALSHLVSQTTLELDELNRNLEQEGKEGIERNRKKDQLLLEKHCGGKLSVSNNADGAVFTVELKGEIDEKA